MPRYLFRGECGEFETTKASVHRRETYTLRDGTRLSDSELQALRILITDLARRFTERADYSLNGNQAVGLVQHYGLPTWMVDLTGNLAIAFAFAAASRSNVARVAVVPSRALCANGGLVDLSDHPWAERPRRQAAFGVITTRELQDLKSEAVRSQLNVTWYEFQVSESDRTYFQSKFQGLLGKSDDPSAGFLRFHITEYVEARGKFSATLTDWLVERVPIVPRCYLVKAIEGEEVIVNYRGANVLPAFDEKAEAERSRRYWSSAHHESSGDRLKN
ncbi:MAG: FRG domain-containing protein [Bryobacteraceae bacterium]